MKTIYTVRLNGVVIDRSDNRGEAKATARRAIMSCTNGLCGSFSEATGDAGCYRATYSAKNHVAEVVSVNARTYLTTH